MRITTCWVLAGLFLLSAPGLSAPGGGAGILNEPVDDPRFGDSADGSLPDQQWHLKNDGRRAGFGDCGDAVRGMDIRVDSIPYWFEARGNPSVVIGIVDGGVARGHEDLSEVIQFGPFPWEVFDLCGSHGTKMAGLAAALTNNGRGIAGVCPRCSIADIALISPYATPERCGSGEDRYIHPALAPRYIGEALDWSLASPDYELASLNIAFSGCPWRETIDILWRAYLEEGTLTAVACGSAEDPCGRTDLFTTRPFILGVGGFTWTGEFWCADSDCHGPDQAPAGTLVGALHVDICGPARGPAMDTHWDPAIPYAPTNLSTSGATACVAGAIGLLRSYWRDRYPGDALPPPGYVAGFLTGSALDFVIDPTTYRSACPDDPRDHYGPGRLNVIGAIRLLEIYQDPGPGPYFHERTLEARDGTVERIEEFVLHDTVCTVDRITWSIPVPGISDPLLPPRVAFVLPERCSTYGEVPFDAAWRDSTRWSLVLHQARRAIRGAHLSVTDPSGRAEVTGILCRISVDGGRSWRDFGTPLDQAAAVYAFLSSTPPESNPGAGDRGPLRIDNPARIPMRIRWRGTDNLPHRSVELFDIGARPVRRLDLVPGSSGLTWDGRDEQGRIVPAGAYWARTRGDSGPATQGFILIK